MDVFNRGEHHEKRIRKREALDREGQISYAPDPVPARTLAGGDAECTMCGEFCAIKIMRDVKYFCTGAGMRRCAKHAKMVGYRS